MRVVFHQEVSYEGSLSSGRCLMRVVFHQGGLLQG